MAYYLVWKTASRACVALLMCLFCGINFSYAQPADVPATIRWGEPVTEPSGSRITKTIAIDKEGFYMLRRKEAGAISHEQVYVEFYDREMELKNSSKIDLKYKGKRRTFEDVVMIGGQLYLFTSYHNQAQKKNYLFYQRLSPRLNPSKKLTKTAEIDTRNLSNTGAFNLVVSKDSASVLLYNQLANKRKEPEQFALRVFDNQLNLKWSRDIILPYNDNQFVIEDYRVDEAGNVYLMGVLFKDGVRRRRSGKPNYEYVILAYTEEGAADHEYKIDITEKFLTDLTFRIRNDGRLVCAGFFSEKGTYSIKGTCFFQLDPQTKQVANLSFNEFDFDFRAGVLNNRQQERAAEAEASGNNNRQAELEQFSLDKLILRSDGGAVLVAEQFYVFEQAYRFWDGTLRFDYFYHYNDIIVVNIRPDGSIEWATRIPKRQETVNDGGYFSSYAAAVVRDRLYFIFNDNSRNFDTNNNRLYNFNGRNSIISLAEINKDGELYMYPLFQNRDAGTLTRPVICKQIGSRKMMVYGERGRAYRFAELTFE
jgi:hypothetical protein